MQVWKGYYIVGVPEGRAEEVLRKGFFSETETLSSYNTFFMFNDFADFKTVALSELKERFVEGDPRVDPYMAGAEKYFFTDIPELGRNELLYVKSSKSALNFYLQTRASYGSEVENWVFPDFNIRHRIAGAVLFSISLIFGIWLLKGLRLLAIAAGIPWVTALLLLSPAMLPAAVMIYILLILAVKEVYPDLVYFLNYRQITFKTGSLFFITALGLSVIIAFIMHFTNKIPVLPLIIAVAADFILVMVYYSLKSQKVRMQEHRIFFPIRLLNDRTDGNDVRKLPVYAAGAAAVILLPLFSVFIPVDNFAAVPSPEKISGIDSWTWENIGLLDNYYGSLPDAADLLKHKAYQEGFMYGADYSFPERNGELRVGNYSIENNEIVYKENSVQQFTDDWYTSIITAENGSGLELLLLSRDFPTGIVLKSGMPDVLLKYDPLRHIIISLLAILPIIWRFISRTSISLRRKGQEA